VKTAAITHDHSHMTTMARPQPTDDSQCPRMDTVDADQQGMTTMMIIIIIIVLLLK